MKFRAIRGVRDILPPESALWNRVEQTAREVFGTYAYQEIRLPISEETDLFRRSVGMGTDIVSKEMYTFKDTLREQLDLRRDRLAWRSSLLQREWRFRGVIEDFVSDAADFLDVAGGAYASGQIPQTGENKKCFDEMHRRIVSWQGKLQDKNFQAPAEQEWFLFLSDVVTHANRLEFGGLFSLRPEATASVVRAYIEHGMHTWPGEVKLYYIGPMFRRERPQKGRYRQFYQIGAEVLGKSDHPAIDAEVIEMLMVYLERLGLARAMLYLNSIGCQKCRPAYVRQLRSELEKVKEKLGADSQRRIETNPLRVLDSKLPEEQAIIEKLPRISDHLCEDCRKHFAEEQAHLKQRGVSYQLNSRLVRGLDYYMRTTFEITAPGLGAQDAICGGGRYDGLVELLGGPPAKGIGFAIGTDRLVLALEHAGKPARAGGPLDVFLAWMGPAAYPAAVKLARVLRAENFSVEVSAEEMKLKKSLSLADKLGAHYAVILGEDELASGSVVVKRLADAVQKKLPEPELADYLRSELRH